MTNLSTNKFPIPPILADNIVPYVYNTGDGWLLGWGILDTEHGYVTHLSESDGYEHVPEEVCYIYDYWPFDNDHVSPAQWQQLGFHIV